MPPNDVQIRIIGKDLAAGAFCSVDVAAQNTARNVAALGGQVGRLNGLLGSTASVAAGIAGFQGISSLMQSTVGSAVMFAKNLETSEIGMAGILVSMTEIDGRTVQWGEALSISQGIIRKLNDEALRTSATSQELVFTFQAILGPALAAKMTIKEMLEFTVTAANAVKSIFPGNVDKQRQMVQEIRDLVQGGIQAASSTLANSLGLKDADINAAKNSAEGLFAFLMKRLKGFEISGDAYSKTWTGITEQLKEGVERIGAQGLSPLFAAFKGETDNLVKQLFVIDETTKEVTLNPELLSGLNSAAKSAVALGGQIKEIGQDVSVVAVPAAKLLGGALGYAADNAKALTYAVAGWMVLSKVSAIYVDIAAVAAGASTAQTFLGRAVLQTRIEYAQQAAEAALAGTTMETAAVAAAMGQYKLAAAIMQVNAAQFQSAAASTTAGADMVRSTAVAGNVVKGLLTTVWALAGGWVGVAIATGLAINALIDYFDTKNKVDSYNQKAEVYEENGKLFKKVRREDQTSSLEFGPQKVVTYDRQELSADEIARHKKYVADKLAMENGDYGREQMNNLDELTKYLTSMFSPAGSSKGAEHAYEEQQRLVDKVADMIAKMNDKISAKTSTIFETESLKLADEIANMGRELDKSKIDFAKYGMDVSLVYKTIAEYQAAMTAEIEKKQSRALGGLIAETGVIRGTRTGDYGLQAEAEYQATLISLGKQREVKTQEVGRDKDDAVAKAAIQNWYTEQIALAAQKRADFIRDGQLKEYEYAITHNSTLLAMGQSNSAAIDEMNRRILSNKINYLEQELRAVGINNEKRAQLNKELVDTINQQNEILSRNFGTALPLALQEISNKQIDYRSLIVSTYDDINNSTLSHFDNMLTGAESFSQGYQNIIGDMVNSIGKMFLRLWYYQMIMKPMQNWLGNVFNFSGGGGLSTPPGGIGGGSYTGEIAGFRAAGGPVQAGKMYIVGERGPEPFMPGVSGTILPNSALGVSGSAPNIKLVVINNTGQQAQVTTEGPKFNGEEFVLSVVLNAMGTNKFGMRDAVRGAR